MWDKNILNYNLMREIKFRGKSVDGEWFFGELQGGDIHIKPSWYEHGQGEWWGYEVEENTIGQLTGLKDKNGVEIYEGDILQMYRHSDETHQHEKGQVWVNDKYENDIREVKYNLGTFYTNGMCNIKVAFLHMARPGESYEVIGNIHDNPELIKKQ